MIEGAPSGAVVADATAPAERIEVVDVLRGFAMFGILIVNMEGLSSPGYRAEDGERLWTGLLDRIVESLILHGAAGKFMIMFTVLFGLSFALQMRRTAARGLPFLNLQARRLTALLLIGLAHAFLIWWGDILVGYALAGFLLLPFQRCRPRTILVWAIALNLLSFVELEVRTVQNLLGPPAESAGLGASTLREAPAPPGSLARAKLDAYGHGTLGDIARRRAQDFLDHNREPYNIVLRRLSFFLVGLFVGSLGILRDLPGHRPLLRRVLAWALLVGVVTHVADLLLYQQGLPSWTRLLRLPVSIVHNPAMACVYSVALILLFQRPAWRARLSPLAAVGRTALSNYLLQSVVCTSLFYSYGLGLYGRLGPAAGLALTITIFALQVAVSGCWLRRFRFGPMEWLWRSLTYGRRQPLRLAADRATSG
jgi:uncharacterized protein